MTQLHFADLTILAAPQNCVYISDTVDWILHSIEDRTWGYVDDIMAADTLAKTFGAAGSTAYFNSLWNSTGTFTHSQFQFATEMIASAWYSAWIDAGSPSLTAVPEPSGLVLLCLGGISLMDLARVRRRARTGALGSS